MPQAAKARPNLRLPHVTLNSDGRRHPLENSLTVFTLVAGLVAFATGWIVSQHMAATVLVPASLVGGLYSQLVSARRSLRQPPGRSRPGATGWRRRVPGRRPA